MLFQNGFNARLQDSRPLSVDDPDAADAPAAAFPKPFIQKRGNLFRPEGVEIQDAVYGNFQSMGNGIPADFRLRRIWRFTFGLGFFSGRAAGRRFREGRSVSILFQESAFKAQKEAGGGKRSDHDCLSGYLRLRRRYLLRFSRVIPAEMRRQFPRQQMLSDDVSSGLPVPLTEAAPEDFRRFLIIVLSMSYRAFVKLFRGQLLNLNKFTAKSSDVVHRRRNGGQRISAAGEMSLPGKMTGYVLGRIWAA